MTASLTLLSEEALNSEIEGFRLCSVLALGVRLDKTLAPHTRLDTHTQLEEAMMDNGRFEPGPGTQRHDCSGARLLFAACLRNGDSFAFGTLEFAAGRLYAWLFLVYGMRVSSEAFCCGGRCCAVGIGHCGEISVEWY